jgi:hypothetical protein
MGVKLRIYIFVNTKNSAMESNAGNTDPRKIIEPPRILF